MGSRVRTRQCAQESRSGRRLLPGGLRLPRRRLPLPDLVCPERRLSPEREGAVAAVNGFALTPVDFAARVATVFADLGSGVPAAGLDRLRDLIVETCGLSSR